MPSLPMPYGYCAMRAADVTAEVTPSPDLTLTANMPLRSAWAARSAEVRRAAVGVSSLQYWMPRYLTPGCFFSSALKPATRSSTVLTPGVVLMMATAPDPPIALTRALAARAPPPGLSVETFVNAIG